MAPKAAPLTGWLLLAISLAFTSTLIDRSTTVEIYSDGGRIHVGAAGTDLSMSRTTASLNAVEILAADSIDPPGGRWITVSNDEDVVLRQRLPRRFNIPPGPVAPLGDWELDEGAGRGSVWKHDVETDGVFTVEVDFRGRFLHDLTVVMHGSPTTSISVRRGLINHDVFIRDAVGNDLASTSIDPTPLADLGAIGATVARSGAVAAFLIAIFGLVRPWSPPRPLPAASHDGPATLLVPALVIAAVALSGWAASDVLEGLPHTPDEVVYLLQASWLLDGRLWSDVTVFQNALAVPFTYVDGARWLAHYPPAWPGLLAAGVAVGTPWLVAPLVGGIYILLLYLAGRELHGPALGLTAATLGVISPMARLIFSSMLSHALAATLILTALVMALRARRPRGWTSAAAAGIALGLAFGVRPLSAAAVLVPVVVLAAFRSGRRLPMTVAAFAGGFGAAATPTLIANALITGSALSFPYSLAHGSMFGLSNIPFGLRNLDVLLASSGAAATGWGWSLFHGPWITALVFAPALVSLFTKRARASDWLLAATALGVVVAYVGTRGHGLHGFGPRYHFEAFAPFFLLTARGFFVLAGLGEDSVGQERRLPVVLSLSLFFALCMPAGAILPHRLSLYRGYNGVDGNLETAIRALAPKRALIVLENDRWQGWAEASPFLDFRADAPILVIQTTGDDPAIAEIAGDRPIFLWQRGRLTAR